MKKLKKNVFKVMTCVMLMICMASVSALDSEMMWIPILAFLVSGGCTIAFAIADGVINESF